MGKKKEAERKALEAREAELRAELEKRAAKKAKKKSKGKKSKSASIKPVEPPKKKSKKSKAEKVETVDVGALGVMTIEAEAPVATEPEPAPSEADELTSAKFSPEAILAAAEKVLSDPNSSPGAKKKATKAHDQAKKDLEPVEAIKAKVAAKRAARTSKGADSARMPDALPDESEAEYQMRKLAEKRDGDVVAKVETAVDALKSAVEEVETETGRVFAAGESVAADEPEEFAKPSDSGPELEEGRNGYKIIQLDKDGNPDKRKVRQLTRVTTFVNNIDDDTALKDWLHRLLVEGISKGADDFLPRINDLMHRRDVAIAKATKADRKGKLGLGELADLIEAAKKEYKTAANTLVEEALELAGRHEAADAGTNLHTLAEISDEKGIEAVREMHERDEISTSELASIEAYAERMRRLNAKVIESEAVVVNDEMGYAGRLDRIIMAKLPELVIGRGTANEYVRPADTRSRRYVADIKSGRLDMGAGKIARQLGAYALGDLYDLETGERKKHSAVRDVALVFHLPQGGAKCSVHAVDIKTGIALLKLSQEVRRARNTGRKTIDISVDITDPAVVLDTEGEESDA